MEKLTIQEEEVMLYIWSIGDCFVKEIVSKIKYIFEADNNCLPPFLYKFSYIK